MKSFHVLSSLAWGIACVALALGCSGKSVRSSEEGGDGGDRGSQGGAEPGTGGASGGGPAGGGTAGAEAGSGAEGGSGAAAGGGAGGLGGVGAGGMGGEGARRSAALVELERVAGLGFCIQPGMLLSARVEADATTGALSFSGSLHVGWEEPPTCPSAQCELTEIIVPRVLSDEDKGELERLLGRLPPVPCEGIPGVVCDPCLGTLVTVDGAEHLAMTCVSGCDAQAMAVMAIGDNLDALAAR